MVKEIGVFDYVDKTPEANEIEDFKLASEKYNIPVRAGGWFYTIGDHKELLMRNLKTAKILGSNAQRIKPHGDRALDHFRHGFVSGNSGGLGMMWIAGCGVNLPTSRIGSRATGSLSRLGDVNPAHSTGIAARITISH